MGTESPRGDMPEMEMLKEETGEAKRREAEREEAGNEGHERLQRGLKRLRGQRLDKERSRKIIFYIYKLYL